MKYEIYKLSCENVEPIYNGESGRIAKQNLMSKFGSVEHG